MMFLEKPQCIYDIVEIYLFNTNVLPKKNHIFSFVKCHKQLLFFVKCINHIEILVNIRSNTDVLQRKSSRTITFVKCIYHIEIVVNIRSIRIVLLYLHVMNIRTIRMCCRKISILNLYIFYLVRNGNET